MPIAKTRLEVLQVRKLIQCVRERDGSQIDKMVELGLPNIVDLQGILEVKHSVKHKHHTHYK